MRLYHKNKRIGHCLILLLLIIGPYTSADSTAEGHLSLGLGYVYQKSLLREPINDPTLFINGRYQWHGIFAEFANGTSGAQTPPTIGYNFYNSDHWNLDAVIAWTDPELTFKGTFNGEEKDFSSKSSAGLGFRSTGAFGRNTLQLVLLSQNDNDIEQGYFAAAWLARNWQLKNWSFQGLIGAQHRSQEVMDYYFGIDPEKSDDDWFPAYEAKSGTRYTLQVDASYPITKHWVFQTYARHTEFSQSAKDSPLMVFLTEHHDRPDNETEFGFLLNYVF